MRGKSGGPAEEKGGKHDFAGCNPARKSIAPLEASCERYERKTGRSAGGEPKQREGGRRFACKTKIGRVVAQSGGHCKKLSHEGKSGMQNKEKTNERG